MKPKDTHIVFGRSARGTLAHSGEFDLDGIRLICMDDMLNIGPLCDVDAGEHRVEEREKWLSKLYEMDDWPYEPPVSGDIDKIRMLADEPEKNGKIFLWTGVRASEILSTARLVCHLPETGAEILVPDFPNVPVKNICGETIYPATLSVTAPEQVRDIFKSFKRVTDRQLSEWKKLWGESLSSDATLRIIDEHGHIAEKSEAYFDPVLESYCTDEFQKAARVIGRTLADTYFNIGDGYLNWRLKQLVASRKLEARGTLGMAREYEVRLPGAEV